MMSLSLSQAAYRDVQTLTKLSLGLWDRNTFNDTKAELQQHLDALIEYVCWQAACHVSSLRLNDAGVMHPPRTPSPPFPCPFRTKTYVHVTHPPTEPLLHRHLLITTIPMYYIEESGECVPSASPSSVVARLP
jgi:hypothetical protein